MPHKLKTTKEHAKNWEELKRKAGHVPWREEVKLLNAFRRTYSPPSPTDRTAA